MKSRGRWLRRLGVVGLPIALILGVAWFADATIRSNGMERVAQPRLDSLNQEAFLISSRLRGRISDLLLLKNMAEKTLAEAPDASGATPSFRILATALMKTRPIYDQIRILDPAGKECFRLNQKKLPESNDFRIEEVAAADLQDKSGRPYYQKALAADPNAAVFSALDLNIENQRLELPIKPMVRVSTQLRNREGGLVGILVLNYLGSNLLRELSSDAPGSDRPLLLNHEGYWLEGPSTLGEWAFMYSERTGENLPHTDPQLWKRLTERVSGHFMEGDTLYCFLNIDPLGRPIDYPAIQVPVDGEDALRFTLVIAVPESVVAEQTSAARKTVWWICILTSLVLAPVIWLGVAAIERREEALKAAQAANQAKADFLGIVSHEIRTPMNGVLGFAELLADGELKAEQRDYVQTIQGAGESLLRIIDDILDFSRIEAGQMEIDRLPFSLREAVQEVHTLLSPQTAKKGIEMRVEIDPGIPEFVVGDRGRLKQVLINLVGNALKFTEKGQVLVRAESSTPLASGQFLVHFSVIDSGEGIPVSQLERIFQPFVQADAGIARRYGGSGLGLAISQRLVGLMGGTIQVSSEPGRGTTFSFSVPFETVAEAPLLESSITQLTSDFALENPLRILAVDDNPVNLKLLGVTLRHLGYQAITATNGTEAVEIFQKERPDCIVMDVQMSGMGGNEATMRIREFEQQNGGAGVRCYVVALSASVIPRERELCFSAGMDEYLTKPLNRQALMDAFRRASQRRTT